MLKGYAFLYTRYSNNEILLDIMHDDDVDYEILKKGTRHDANICFK